MGDETPPDGPSRRDILKYTSSSAVLAALAGCNFGSDDSTDDTPTSGETPTDEETPTETAEETATETEEETPTETDEQSAVYAIDPSALVEGISDEDRATFRDVRYDQTTSPGGLSAPTHLVAYGHDPSGEQGDETRRPTLSAGVVTTPRADGENPLGGLSLRSILVEQEITQFRRAIGLPAEVEFLGEPIRVETSEATALDQPVETAAFLVAVPRSETEGPTFQRLSTGTDSRQVGAGGPGVGFATVYAARVPVGGSLAVVGMLDRWTMPVGLTPAPGDFGPGVLEIAAEAREAAIKAELFRRSLGALGRLGISPDDLPPPPETSRRSESLGRSPVGLTAQGQIDLGYPTESSTTIQNRQSHITGRSEWTFLQDFEESDFDRGTRHIIEFETQVRSYTLSGGDETYPIAVVTSPRLTMDGKERNPLVNDDLTSLLSGLDDNLLEHTLPTLDIYDNQYSLGWDSGPNSQTTNSGRQMLGQTVQTEVFDGTLEQIYSGGGPNKDTEVHVARYTSTNEVVIAITANVTSGLDYWDRRSSASRLFDLALPRLDFGVSTPGTFHDLDVNNLRLVQTVAETRVDSDGGVIHQVDDPPLVAGDNAAPVFSLPTTSPATSDRPLQAIVEADIANMSSRPFSRLSRADTDALGKATNDPASVLHDQATDSRSENEPIVFDLADDHNSVTMHAKALSGYQYDDETVSSGSDYSIDNVDPLSVGFISVTDPDNGSNYGNSSGRASNFNRSVAVALEYLSRTYPGLLYAYRHDNNIAGHRKGVFGRGEFLDFGDAQTDLQNASQSGSFPSNGEVFAFGARAAAAERYISARGFDVWVLIVPQGYYDHHGQDASGLAPASPNQAVSTREQMGNQSDRETAQIVAQEIGHHFVDDPYDDSGSSGDYPMAQRDDEGTDRNITGGLGGDVDVDHARYEDSNEDPDTSTDDPGVVSQAFDLTNQAYRQVDDYTVNPGTFNVRQNSATDVTTKESFMSYESNESLWTDATIHKQLINASWSAVTLGENIFSGIAAEREEGGRLVFDSMRATTGRALTESEEEGNVVVEMVAPDGEVLASRRVSDSLEEHHNAPESSGIIAVQFEFPQTTAEIRTRRNDVESRTNPIVGVLRDAVERVPDRGFGETAEDGRTRLEDTLSQIESIMADNVYDQALETLDEFTSDVESVVRSEYDAAANQPDRDDLLELSERMSTRLQALSEYTAG